MSASKNKVTAAIVIIGDEVLSGRTRDENLAFMSKRCTEIGIRLQEARVVADIESAIIEAINELRARNDYVFTTGGIGPTHDDITADSIGAAFGLPVGYHPEAKPLLEKYLGDRVNEARMRMARTPEGAELIPNSISIAPGFIVDNVHVMAGVPAVCRVMFEWLVDNKLRTGDKMISRTISAHVPEGEIANGLAELAAKYDDVDIGSYPFYREGKFGAALVVRGTVATQVTEIGDAIEDLVRSLGQEPLDFDPAATDPGNH